MSTKSDLWNQLRYIVKFLDSLTTNNAGNIKTQISTIQSQYSGDHISKTDSALLLLRSQMADILTNGTPLNELIIELAKIGYYSQNNNISGCLMDIAKGMVLAGETIKNRAYTIGVPTAYVSNVGTGNLYYNSKDKYGYTIESGFQSAGTLRFDVLGDKSSGGETTSIYTNGLPYVDSLDYGSGTPSMTYLSTLTNTNSILSNSNFGRYSSTMSATAISDWTIATPANASFNTTTLFRTNTVSLNFTGSNAITQNNITNFNKSMPLLIIARVMRKSSADGTVTIALGSKSETINVSTLTNDVWKDVIFGLNNVNGWYDSFKLSTIPCSFTYSGWSTGSIIIGEIIGVYGVYHDNQFYYLVSGNTDFIKGDYFTQENSVANTGRIQTLLAKYYNFYFPHTSGTPTYADL